MTSLLRLGLCAFAACGLLAGTAALDPPTAASFGVDVWSLPDLERQVQENEQRAAELDRFDAVVRGRLEEKLRLTAGVLDGRVTLRQAAARFTELNARQPAMTEQVRSVYPGRTEEESTCRQVLGFAESRVTRERPDQREAFDRLREEFEALLREQGSGESAPSPPAPR
jgi:hypothetical protein